MTAAPPIPETVPVGIRVDESGRLRVGSSRVLVEGILILYRTGESAPTLLDSFPTMEAADLYGTIAFYLRNKAVMDDWLDRVADEEANALRMIDEHPRSRAANLKFHRLFEEHMARINDSTAG